MSLSAYCTHILCALFSVVLIPDSHLLSWGKFCFFETGLYEWAYYRTAHFFMCLWIRRLSENICSTVKMFVKWSDQVQTPVALWILKKYNGRPSKHFFPGHLSTRSTWSKSSLLLSRKYFVYLLLELWYMNDWLFHWSWLVTLQCCKHTCGMSVWIHAFHFVNTIKVINSLLSRESKSVLYVDSLYFNIF